MTDNIIFNSDVDLLKMPDMYQLTVSLGRLFNKKVIISESNSVEIFIDNDLSLNVHEGNVTWKGDKVKHIQLIKAIEHIFKSNYDGGMFYNNGSW